MSKQFKMDGDYFLHPCTPTRTVEILEHKYGNNGYVFWYRLLEFLCSEKNHTLDIKNIYAIKLLSEQTLLPLETCYEILSLLANIEAIDPTLWKQGIVKVPEDQYLD